MEDYLSFRKMITPVVIKVIFWIGVAICVISGLVAIGGSFGHYGGGATAFLGGLFTIILGPVVVRIYCEILILIFKINDTLTEIREALAKKK